MATMPAQSAIKYEAPQSYSRDDITVVSGQNLAANTVLGKITASSKYTAWAPGAADGSQNACAVLVSPVNASAADAPGVAIARHAIVAAGSLVYAGTPTDPQKATALAALRALGIVARTTV
jgi:hypothetical protein